MGEKGVVTGGGGFIGCHLRYWSRGAGRNSTGAVGGQDFCNHSRL